MNATLRTLLTKRPLATFFVLAYAITWLIEAPLVASAQGWVAWPVPFGIHYVAQFGPMVAALIMTAAVGGRAGLRALRARVTRWRIGPLWGLAAVSPLLLFAVSAAIARAVDGAWPDPHRLGEVNFLPYLGLWALPLWLVTNGCGEEIGWRGFALPRLQQRHNALVATLLLWVGWAGWHLPLFFYVPTYLAFGVAVLPGFFLGLLAGAILLTWLANNASGSLLTVIVWHGTFNYVTASKAGDGTVAIAMSVLVMVWAVVVLILGWRARPRNAAVRPAMVGAGG